MTVWGSADGAVPTPDDWSQMYTRELRILNADSGFEANAEMDGGWRQTSGSATVQSSVFSRGSRALQIQNGSATFRIRVSGGTELYRLRMQYKGGGSGTSYKLAARRVSFPTGTACGSSGMGLPTVGAWCTVQSFGVPSAASVWTFTSSEVGMPPYPSGMGCPTFWPPGPLSTIDLQFTIASPGTLWVDDARLEMR